MESHHHVDQELLDTQRGLWVVKVTFVALVLTAVVEGGITLLSGSAALLADTLHGLANAVTTLPLWVAFAIGRRKPTSQFTYGFQRAEDVAGIFILLFIAGSAALVGYASVIKLLEDSEPSHVPWAMAAGAVGIVVNEAIAQYRIKVGKQIGSAALIADGHHARVDGLGSLAVVLGLAAVLLGYPLADPAVGLAITGILVLLLVKESGPTVLSRVMDRIDAGIVSDIQRVALEVPGVLSVHDLRARWVGHRLLADLSISVQADLTVAEGHRIAEQVQHNLMHSIDKWQYGTIHVEPFEGTGAQNHTLIAHHLPEDASDYTTSHPLHGEDGHEHG